MKTILFTFLILIGASTAHAQTAWVSAPVQVRPPITYAVPLAPPQYYIAPQPVVRYHWTPYYYNAPVTVWRYGCFGVRRWPVTIYQPHMQWHYRSYPNYTIPHYNY